jgi:hypothetical protein
MDLITLDFETYYDKDYSLSKLTTEEYIRDPQFEVVGVGVKVNNGETEWASGTMGQIKKYLHRFDWANSMMLAHNTMFDGAIASWHFDIHPKALADTMHMARALHGVEASASLKAVADRYGVGVKGTEVVRAMGKRREDFSSEELSTYGDYCINDVELTYRLFQLIAKKFPMKELKLIDLTLRMFTDPTLELDKAQLEAHLVAVQERKEQLLVEAGIEDKGDLMSNPKFALMLNMLGVTPPMKVSPTTGKETFAFAKNDEAFKALLEHDDDRVQSLVAARLGTKSTLEETRTQRFIGIAERGKLPVPVRYYAAHTGRWGGDDKINLQNLPSRGPNAKALKKAIIAPEGHTIIEADSAQIEARVLAWLAEQEDLVSAFTNREDVYKKMASTIYGVAVDDVDKDQRFVGKTTILGCIGAGTMVLCDSGWKPIEQVSSADKVWDGEEFVCHQGLVPKGIKETLSLCGSWLTPDHKILCGGEWKETGSVVLDECTLSQALDTGQEKLPYQATYAAHGVELKPSLSRAIAAVQSTPSTSTTSKTSRPPAALSALRTLVCKNGIGSTQKLCQMINTGLGYLTGYPQLSHAAITQAPIDTPITGVGVSTSTKNGELTGLSFSSLCKHWMGGTIQSLKWTESTIIKGMSPATYGSQPEAKTCGISEESKPSKRLLQTYDIAYAGPRNRFTILTNNGPVIAHNCGYGMGAVKFQAQLKTFGFDMPLDEARRVINIYRDANWNISNLWKQAQNMLRYMAQGDKITFGKAGVIGVDPAKKALILPSGLPMYYSGLFAVEEEKGPQYYYKTRAGDNKIYGGKVVENVCQAIARCIIGEQMLKIAKRYKVVLTVHDSIVCCVPDAETDAAKAYVEESMRWVPDWAAGLPVDCEAGTAKSYGECG